MLEISSGYGMGVRCDIGTEAWLRLCLVQVISIIVNIHEVCCRYGGGNVAVSGRGHQQVMNMHDGCWTYDGGIGGGTWICMRYGVGVEAGLQLCLAEVISRSLICMRCTEVGRRLCLAEVVSSSWICTRCAVCIEVGLEAGHEYAWGVLCRYGGGTAAVSGGGHWHHSEWFIVVAVDSQGAGRSCCLHRGWETRLTAWTAAPCCTAYHPD